MVTNLIAPAASGSKADMLRSGRTFQPAGDWAKTCAMEVIASTKSRTDLFICARLLSEASESRGSRIGSFGEPLYAGCAVENRRVGLLIAGEFPATWFRRLSDFGVGEKDGPVLDCSNVAARGRNGEVIPLKTACMKAYLSLQHWLN